MHGLSELDGVAGAGTRDAGVHSKPMAGSTGTVTEMI